MSDEQVVEAEETKQTEVSNPGSEPETKPRPKDLPEDQEWDRVEMDEKTQRRFNRLYASTKQAESALKQSAKDSRALADRLDKVERETKESITNSEISDLKKAKTAALEEDDHAKVVEIDARMLDLKTAPREVPKEIPKEETKEPDWFTPERQSALVSWAGEMAEDGNYKRPWAQEGHPRNARAVEITNAVINDPEFLGSGIGEMLSEVDRLMAPRKKATGAVVLSGGQHREVKDKIELSEDQKFVARNMYDELPEKEAYKRYSDSVKRQSS